jgi:hypothetical protein
VVWLVNASLTIYRKMKDREKEKPKKQVQSLRTHSPRTEEAEIKKNTSKCMLDIIYMVFFCKKKSIIIYVKYRAKG